MKVGERIVPVDSIPPYEHEILIMDDDPNIEDNYSSNIFNIIYIERYWQPWRTRHLITNKVLLWANENSIRLKLIRRKMKKIVKFDNNSKINISFYRISIAFESLSDMVMFKLTWL